MCTRENDDRVHTETNVHQLTNATQTMEDQTGSTAEWRAGVKGWHRHDRGDRGEDSHERPHAV
jgi:hypothetical protein